MKNDTNKAEDLVICPDCKDEYREEYCQTCNNEGKVENKFFLVDTGEELPQLSFFPAGQQGRLF